MSPQGAAPPAHRRLSAVGLARLLGTWRRSGSAHAALSDAVRSAVLAGSVPLSTRLPSERELAATLGVSRTTTATAYRTLRDEGYLTSRHGSGSVTTLPGPSRTATLTDLALATQPEVVDFSIAAPAAPAGLAEAYGHALEALPRYLAGRGYTPLGLDVLRAAIARRYTDRGVPTSPAQILVTSGAQHAISLLVQAHIGPGDRALVEHPTYPHAIEAIRAAGGRPVPVPVGATGTDLDLLASTLRQVSPRLVYLIPDHHNPTGTSLSPEGRERVRELARRHRTVVVGDEALTDLTLDGDEPTPFAGAGGSDGVIVSVGSASKSFWGGLRIGWVRAHPDLVARLARVRASVDISTAVLEQLVVVELLDRRDELLSERRGLLRARRDLAVGLLHEHLPGWRVAVPAGGLAVWADLGAPASSALAALALRHGVRVQAGPAFGVDGSFERNLRVTFTEPPESIERGVRGLAAAWAALGSPADDGVGAPLRVVV